VLEVVWVLEVEVVGGGGGGVLEVEVVE